MTPEERANRIMDDIANNCSSLKDVADEIRQAENAALERAAVDAEGMACHWGTQRDEDYNEACKRVAAAIRRLKHVE